MTLPPEPNEEASDSENGRAQVWDGSSDRRVPRQQWEQERQSRSQSGYGADGPPAPLPEHRLVEDDHEAIDVHNSPVDHGTVDVDHSPVGFDHSSGDHGIGEVAAPSVEPPLAGEDYSPVDHGVDQSADQYGLAQSPNRGFVPSEPQGYERLDMGGRSANTIQRSRYQQPDPPRGIGKLSRKARLGVGLLGLGAVLVLLFLSYQALENQATSTDNSALGAQTAAGPADQQGEPTDTTAGEQADTSDQAGDAEQSELAAESDTTVTVQESAESTEPADDSTVPSTVRGLLTGDEVIVEGEVPSEQVADSVIELLSPLASRGSVINQLVIDPGAPAIQGVSVVVADEVVFAAGSDDISPEFFATLDQMVAVMQLSPDVTVVVEGHTDTAGDEVQNLALSQRRAEAVVDYIAANSINRFRLEPRGRGSGEPVDDNATEAGRSRNRRIEFEVTSFGLTPGE